MALEHIPGDGPNSSPALEEREDVRATQNASNSIPFREQARWHTLPDLVKEIAKPEPIFVPPGGEPMDQTQRIPSRHSRLQPIYDAVVDGFLLYSKL